MSTWSIDGYDLTKLGVRDVESRYGQGTVTAPNGSDVQVANRHGELWTPKRLGPGQITLMVWLSGASEQEALYEWETLVRVAAPLHRLVTVSRVMPGTGLIRTCEAELTGTVQPLWLGSRGARATLIFKIPSGKWEDKTPNTVHSLPGAALPQTLTLGFLADSTAPVDSCLFTIAGPVTNPTLVDVTTGGGGDECAYTGTVPDGGVLNLNSGTWEVSTDGSWTANPGAVSPSGPRYMTFYPVRYGSYHQVRLSGTGGGVNTRLSVVGRNAHR